MTQNTADPAPAAQNSGKDSTPTAAYWCVTDTSLPETQSKRQCGGVDRRCKNVRRLQTIQFSVTDL